MVLRRSKDAIAAGKTLDSSGRFCKLDVTIAGLIALFEEDE